MAYFCMLAFLEFGLAGSLTFCTDVGVFRKIQIRLCIIFFKLKLKAYENVHLHRICNDTFL